MVKEGGLTVGWPKKVHTESVCKNKFNPGLKIQILKREFTNNFKIIFVLLKSGSGSGSVLMKSRIRMSVSNNIDSANLFFLNPKKSQTKK